MEVGVREFKKHLSAWLERAAQGEVIRITDHGRPKAILGPLPGQLRLEAGLAHGWVTVQEATAPRPARRHPARRSTADVLAEDRGE